MRLTLALLAVAGLMMALSPASPAQGKKGKKQDPNGPPQVKLVNPLGVPPGGTVKLTLRGLRLDEVVQFVTPGVPATFRLLDQGKSPPPDKLPPNVAGDTQAVIEVALPKELPGDFLDFIVVSLHGESAPHRLWLDRDPVLAEKEPNDGFRQAQAIHIPQVVYGTVGRGQDVDVFRFEGKAGQRIMAEVFAARSGSPLDSILTLYDAAGQELANNDDAGGGVDSRLECTLPRDGTYYLSLIDAHDAGGQSYAYRLHVKEAR